MTASCGGLVGESAFPRGERRGTAVPLTVTCSTGSIVEATLVGTGTTSRMRHVLWIVTVIVSQPVEGFNSVAVRWKRQACGINQYQCKSSSCFDQTHLCDGTKHCDDGTDESADTCSRIPCPSEAFRCDYGACIGKPMLCNGKAECADGSDEKPEVCRAPSSSGCQLPPQPENGQYKLAGCNPPACQPIVGDTVRNTFLTYTCPPDFALSGSGIVLCDDGWSSEFPTCSRVSCPALVDPSRIIKCTLNDTQVECNKTMDPGTRAVVTCEFFYTHIKEFSRYVTECQPNGKWSRDITPCIPKCGEQSPQELPLFAGGSKKTQYGDYPWHAGIYKLINEKYEQICGGSIISQRTIVSAATCFWNHTSESKLDAKNFKIMVGKYYRDFQIQQNEIFVQIPEVKNILIYDGFRGSEGRFSSNVALILLKDTIRMSAAVRPVCVDFNRDHDRLFTPGKTGIVVSWGVTEDLKMSGIPLYTKLNYVAMEQCEKEVPTKFLPFLTGDVFCAGSRNGTTVCPGEDGESWVTQFRDGLWYLMGIMSVGDFSDKQICTTYSYGTFTRVAEFYEFLENNI